MYNVDPSSLRSTPTRLILKLGDDLRQDVIVLRMLSLFEKVWNKNLLMYHTLSVSLSAMGRGWST